ncbi:MAG: hypothetical protein SGPRY_011259, partial [Prymnesium sp.]
MASEELIVRADDPRLLLENVFHQEGEGGRVHFDRCYDRQYGCEGGALSQHPGATISFLTDAESGVLTLQYNEQCDESCPGTMPDGCYHPKSMCVDQHEGLCGTCRAYCAPKLYIAGERITLPPLVARSSYNQGEVKLAIFKQSSRSAVPRRFDIVMPWAADVSFVGLRLRNVKQLKQPRRLTFRYVAYGDSITHGFCADTPYPEHIARENGWSALNLGIGGISITPHHGGALADLKPDLISTLIGTNNWPWDCDVSAKMAQFLDNIRHRLQHVPIVVVTPITRGEEGELNAKRCATLEDTREQIRRVVARRQRAGDNRIFLVEGRPLLPMYHLHDRLHPGDSSAMRDLGLNLNAQMGFSKVQYTVSPDCPDLKVHAHGLTPGGRSALYYGNHMVNTDIAASDGCIGRTLMIGGHLKGRISRTANEMGQATFSLQDIEAGHNCATAFFQILDFVTCVTSKVGLGSEGRDSLDDTAAEILEARFERARMHVSERAVVAWGARKEGGAQEASTSRGETRADAWLWPTAALRECAAGGGSKGRGLGPTQIRLEGGSRVYR